MRVVIAEDLALLRDGLTRLLRDNGFEVVAAVEDATRCSASSRRSSPTSRSSTSACRPRFATRASARRSRPRRAPETAILVVSQYVEQTYATELLADGRGGVGYLLKDRIMDVADFVDAVRRVAEGGTALDPGGRRPALLARKRGPLEGLTPRELEVLGLMAEAVERGIAAGSGAHRRRGREAHREHPQEARPSAFGERPLPRARRAHLPPARAGELTLEVARCRPVSGARCRMRRWSTPNLGGTRYATSRSASG